MKKYLFAFLFSFALLNAFSQVKTATMALAMKEIQADPKNVNYQNNLAAILSQSGYPEQAIPYLKATLMGAAEKVFAQKEADHSTLHTIEQKFV